jgi:hypothetical protein
VVFVVVMLATLFVCAALSIDVGQICAVAAEQQNTADAGALAGSTLLQEKRSEDVIEDVEKLIARNQRFQGYESIEDQVIELGQWDSVNHVFTALSPDEWERGAFAVRVRAYRNNLKHFFAGVMGRKATDVSREAVAVGSRDCRGIWGLEGIKAGSIVADSYDSTDGAYDGLTARDNGDLCSGRGITIMGSIDLHGDAMSGFGYPVSVSGSSGEITGITTSRLDDPPAVTVDLSAVEYSNDNHLIGLTSDGRSPFRSPYYVDISGGATLELPPGTLYFDSIKLSGGASLTVVGTTTIYVKGNIDATGGTILNKTRSPNDLTIYCTGSAIKLGGGTAFYGGIVAPEADVTLSGTSGTYYGVLIGKTVTFNGGYTIHVDESSPLLDLMPKGPPPMLVR